MAYSKTTWVNGVAPAINDTNLNKIETGIDEAHDANDLTGAALTFHIADTSTHGVSEVADAALVLANVVEDTTPQLGGDLDLQANTIVGNGSSVGLTVDSNGQVGMGLGYTGTSPQKPLDVAGDINFTEVAAPLASFTLTGAAGGSLDDGAVYWYSVVYVTADGETEGGYKGADYRKEIDLDPGQTAVNITGIPTSSDTRVTARKIYRTTGGGSVSLQYLLTTLNDNTTTTYVDTTADGSLDTTDGTYRKDNATIDGIYLNNSIFANMGEWNASYGFEALGNVTTGKENFVFGRFAAYNITTGNDNLALGSSALFGVTTGKSNIGLGYATNYYNQTGSYNIAIGNEAIRLAGSGNVTGNVGIGYLSLHNLVSGDNYNTAYGYKSGYNFQGSNNIFIGQNTGALAAATAIGDYNLFIGDDVGDNATTGAANNILIGKQLDLQTPGGSNQISIGNIIFATGIDGTGSTISTGSVGIGTAAPGNPLAVNRAADGIIVDFESADTVEGNVSIAGNTTSYNAFVGSHYTQLKAGQKELPIGAVVISTGEIIPCEAESETTEETTVLEKDAFETVEIPAVEAVPEHTVTKYHGEDGVIKTREEVVPAVEAQDAYTEKRFKTGCVLNEDTGTIHKDVTTTAPKDVSGKEYFTYVDTTTTAGDKRVYGVWNSKLSDDATGMSFGQDAKPVYLISQVGHYKIRVTDTNGNITIGDYLESSTRPMEAQKQTSTQKLNSTIAKALIDVDWTKIPIDMGVGYKWTLIPCTF